MRVVFLFGVRFSVFDLRGIVRLDHVGAIRKRISVLKDAPPLFRHPGCSRHDRMNLTIGPFAFNLFRRAA